ncbi:hypothetical protein Tco_1025242 [Tanacetum coccineum]
MAYNSSSSNANSKVHTCSTECEQSYAQLKKLYDTQREQLGDASIEIQAYTQALKKVEAQLVAHQKNQLCQLSANDKAGFGHNGAKESKVSETITSVSKVETSNSETSNDKVEMPKIKTVRMSEPIIEEWESDSEDDEIVVKPKEVTKIVKRSFEKIKFVNARNETVGQAENPRKNNKSPRGLVSLNTAKSVSTAQSRKTINDAMPTTYSYYKAYSSVKRPFNKKTANYNRYFNKRVNTVKSTMVNTARPKAEVNTVKASTSWVWKPKHEELDHVFKSNSASKTLTRYDYVDALGMKLVLPALYLVLLMSTLYCSSYISTASCMFILPMAVNTASLIFEVQTASGKEFSNPLIADSLLKTIWFSTHHASQLRVG